MAIAALNHLTFAVSNLKHSIQFYTQGLGLHLRKEWETGAYLSGRELWICLSLDEAIKGVPKTSYTHVAFTAHNGVEMNQIIKSLRSVNVREWQKNSSEGESFYFLDPDGHKMEIHVGDLETRLLHMSKFTECKKENTGNCYGY